MGMNDSCDDFVNNTIQFCTLSGKNCMQKHKDEECHGRRSMKEKFSYETINNQVPNAQERNRAK
jgi:hypothetical protein